jgi:hypothetical protein
VSADDERSSERNRSFLPSDVLADAAETGDGTTIIV